MTEPDIDVDELLHAMLDSDEAGNAAAFETVTRLLSNMKAYEDNQHKRLWSKLLSRGRCGGCSIRTHGKR